MAVDPLKVIVQVQNMQELAELKQKAAVAAGEIGNLNQQLKAGAINSSQFAAQAKPFADTVAASVPRIKELEKAIAASGHGGIMAAQGLMQLGYAVDDLQYGFSAIVNNIGPVVAGLGLGAGVAGALQIAGVAANQLYRHWDQVVNVFQSQFSGVPLSQLEKLRVKAEETADAFKKVIESKSRLNQESQEASEKVISEGPAPAILKGIVESLGSTGLGAQKTELEERSLKYIARGEEWKHDNPAQQKMFLQVKKGVDERIRKSNEETAKQLMVDLAKGGKEGEAARATLGDLAKQRPGAFPQGFEEKLKELSPEAIRAREKKDESIKETHKTQEVAKSAQEADRARADKEVQKTIDRLKVEREKDKENRGIQIDIARQAPEEEKRERQRQRDIRSDALQEQKWQIQQAMQQPHPQMQVGGSVFDFLKGNQEALLNNQSPQKQQLAALQSIDKVLHSIEQEAKKDKRAQVFGP
jgi:hypothetical protein